MKSNFWLYTFLFLTIACRAGAQQGDRRLDLIPRPSSVELSGRETFTITAATVISTTEYEDLAAYLNEHLEAVWGMKLAVTHEPQPVNRIVLKTMHSLPPEGYTLRVTADGVELAGHDRAGVFYALQTLFQLMPPSIYGKRPAPSALLLQVPLVAIEDAPRYAYRGVMLDVSRTFFDKQTVMQYIDWAARHKINKLHWHLTDDNGWRIEIKKYPLLTQRGAWRGPGEALPPSYGSGNQRYGGYYTQEDIREIVRFAAFRNVEIIPEIDLPGHSLAVTTTYPEVFCDLINKNTSADEEVHDVWCAGREENYQMLRDILSEVAALFPSKFIHIGGDEVNYKYWSNCTRCKKLVKDQNLKTMQNLQHYFIRRLESILLSLGKEPAAWNEAIKGGNLNKHTVIYGWQNLKVNAEAVEKGQRVVMVPANYLYIDMKQSAYERGHTWAWLVDTRRLYSFDPALAGIPENRQKLILGVEAAQWGELLDRPERFLEYQGYPKLCALAEVGWTAPKLRNWDDFYRRLTEGHLGRLAAMSIQFRMFPPEVTYTQGEITATAPMPSTDIRYTTDYSEPDLQSARYTGPIRDNHPERYRFRTFYQGGYSPAVPPATKVTKTVTQRAKETYTFPLADYTDRNGLWLLTVTPEEEDLKIDQLVITGLKTPYYIIRNGQKANPFGTLRLYLDDTNRQGTLSITFSNATDRPNRVVVGFMPSPYVEPEVSISSSLSATTRFPLTNLSDYNFISYARSARPCKKGDYVVYTFGEPADCQLIDIRTGIPNVTRYIVTQGKVEYSADGVNFVPGGTLDANGGTTIRPAGSVKAVRILIDGGNGEPQVAFQDLRVVPKL